MATLLSFLWPGLGQWYAGRPRAALAYAVPVLAVAVYVACRLTGGLQALAVDLITPSFALTALVVIVALGAWRVISMADALTQTQPRSRLRSGFGLTTFAVLTVVTVAFTGLGAYYAYSFYDAGSHIFVAAEPTPSPTAPLGTSDESPTPGTSGAIATSPIAPPTPTPSPASATRLTVLILGIDSGPGRAHALTDTMLVVSVDRTTGKAVMLSVPRDTSNFALYGGGTFSGKLNALMSTAARDPARYPDGAVGTLEKELGYLLGIPIDYYASTDLVGFPPMIDAVGGIDIVNPRAIDDPTDHYDLSAGSHHFDGTQALQWVRERKGLGDSDFTRAARQQDLLVALKAKLVTPALLTQLPTLLHAAAQTIRTDVPTSRLQEFLSLASKVSDSSIAKYVLGPPYAYHPPDSQTGGIYTLVLNMDKVKALSVKLFGAESRYAAR